MIAQEEIQEPLKAPQQKKVYIETTESSSSHSERVVVNDRHIGDIVFIGSNCKFNVIDNISYAWAKNDEDFKANLDALFKRSRLSVLIQTTNLQIVDFIKEHYDVYATVILPIGYTDGYQYHITVRNKLTTYGNFRYARTVKNVKVEDSENMNESIVKLFKKNRRKTDIIPDILKILKLK